MVYQKIIQNKIIRGKLQDSDREQILVDVVGESLGKHKVKNLQQVITDSKRIHKDIFCGTEVSVLTCHWDSWIFDKNIQY